MNQKQKSDRQISWQKVKPYNYPETQELKRETESSAFLADKISAFAVPTEWVGRGEGDKI